MEDHMTFICKRTVVSTKPVQPDKYCTLSVLDRLMEMKHLKIVYYYNCPGGQKFGEVIKKLRESLAEVLTSYPIMTGRLQRNNDGHWMIKCNDAGVRMVEARAKGSIEDYLQDLDEEKEKKLVHWEEIFHKSYYWSTFYVKLTEFEDGGVAIGLSCTHLLADPICVTMFIRAWADTTLYGKMVSPPLFHPLPARRLANKNHNHKPLANLINNYESFINNPNQVTNDTKYKTVSFLFTDQSVRTCIAMAKANGSPNGLDPSPFEALSALFWLCVSKIKGVEEGLVGLCLCLDMRNVLGLDMGFFGNCMVYNKLHASVLQENRPLVEVARKIRKVVENLESEKVMDLIEWLVHNDKDSSRHLSFNDIVCANLENIQPYHAMFDDGFVPLRVSYYIKTTCEQARILVLPAPPTEGPLSRVVMITLSEDEIVKLCEDDFIQKLNPTVIMGMNKKIE